MDQNEWAQKKAEQIRKQRGGSDEDKKVRKEVGELKRSQMPKMWTETRQSLRRRMDLINERLGEHMLEWAGLDANKVVVRALEAVDQLLSVTYHPDILVIRCEYPDGREEYRPKVTANKEVVLLEARGDEKRADELAEHIFDKFTAGL
jgi:hypothetical protein